MENQINEELERPVDVIQPQAEIFKKKFKKDTYKIKECKVIMATDEVIAVSFDSYGISLDKNKYSNAKIGDIVNIEYKGEIGTKNFKIKK